MPMKMNLRTRLLACVASIVVLSILLGAAGLTAVSSLSDFANITLDGTIHKSNLAESIVSDALALVSAQRGLILGTYSKNAAQVESNKNDFQKTAASIQKSLEEIRPLLVTEEGHALTADISSGFSEWQSVYDELLRQCSTGNPEQANKIRGDSITPISDRVVRSSRRLADMQVELMAANRVLLQDRLSQSRWILISLFLLSLGASGLIAHMVHKSAFDLRGSVAQLAEGASQVSVAARQVASGSQTMAQGSSKQAASIEETSASTEEINSMARKNSENSRSAAVLVGKAQQRFTQTNQALQEMVVAMGEITAGSDKISKIIRVIDEIAFQTNILALNAAVEAARAGEAGMGFAVVADEVRSLAQRSAQAAKDTASLIEDSISKSNGGKVKVDEVASAIHLITGEFSQIKTLVDEISLGSQEQAKGTDQIGRVMTELERATQSNAASAEESASVAEELTAQANSLTIVVNRLTEIVGRDESNPILSFAKSRPVAPVPVRAPMRAATPVREPVPVTGGEFPLDEDFKEF
jgi:methyl-accepting chemotaxis protein